MIGKKYGMQILFLCSVLMVTGCQNVNESKEEPKESTSEYIPGASSSEPELEENNMPGEKQNTSEEVNNKPEESGDSHMSGESEKADQKRETVSKDNIDIIKYNQAGKEVEVEKQQESVEKEQEEAKTYSESIEEGINQIQEKEKEIASQSQASEKAFTSKQQEFTEKQQQIQKVTLKADQ